MPTLFNGLCPLAAAAVGERGHAEPATGLVHPFDPHWLYVSGIEGAPIDPAARRALDASRS